MTLGEPVTSPAPSTQAGVSCIYTFDGRAGQEVIGQFKSSAALPDGYETG